MNLKNLKNKNILILGFGQEGKDSYLALRKLFPEKVLGIADKLNFKDFSKKVQKTLKSDKKLKLHFGENYLKYLKNYNLIIKTPGIPQEIAKPFLAHSTDSGQAHSTDSGQAKTKITSQTEIFLENCQGVIIGVTGTKGKGTTVSLIYKILKTGGLKVKLVGNIGKPVFQTLLKSKKNDIFVYEMSSHQLENLKKSPQIAVFLNLYPAHLDYYKNFAQYKKAKENILRYQTEKDFFIYNSDQKELREIAKLSKAKKIPITATKYEFITNIRKNLPGLFNIFNIASAVAVAELFNVPKNKIIEAIKEFKPLPHRLEFVGKYRGIEFYNDSLATVPQASEAALEALKDRVKTLIFGGMSVKGFKFSQVAKKILKSKIKNLILFPDTGEAVFREISKLKNKGKNLPKVFFVSRQDKESSLGGAASMREALKIAFRETKKGICLLSPGSPSFNLFRDYKERGNMFKKFVKSFAREDKPKAKPEH